MDINKKDYTYTRGSIEKERSPVKKIGKCKFIIDDGSHVPEHQLLTFNYLFNECLEYGGIYIIRRY